MYNVFSIVSALQSRTSKLIVHGTIRDLSTFLDGSEKTPKISVIKEYHKSCVYMHLCLICTPKVGFKEKSILDLGSGLSQGPGGRGIPLPKMTKLTGYYCISNTI